MRTTSTIAAVLIASVGVGPLLRAQATPVAAAAASKSAPAQATSSAVNPGATPTLLIFSDFDCPYSAQTYRQIAALTKDPSVHVHVVYKQSPLPIHEGSQLNALAGLAASRQGRYDQMAELLYASQGPKTEDTLVSFAHQAGLNEAQFRRDLKSPDLRSALDADLAEGGALGVDSTPTLFIDGKRLVGVQTEASLEALVHPAATPPPPATVDAAGSQLAPALVEALETTTPRSRGLTTAPVTVVEFTDFQCPFCRQAVEPMQKLLEDRGRQVRWVFRSYPLSFHPDAVPAAEAAFAAGAQGRFWEMHDLLFAHQDALAPNDLRNYAEQLHLDMQKFDEAMRTHRFAGEVAADRALGDKAGVEGTPTFVIDGEQVSGVRSLPELEQMVDATLLRTPGKPARTAVVMAADAPSIAPHAVFGPETGAPLTITWFTDVRSPLAARQATLIHMLTDHYDGKVTVLYKAFPLQVHSDGEVAATALLAAQEQGKFWPMYDALSEDHTTISRERAVAVAAHLNLDMARFQTQLDAAPPAVMADLDEAARRGVTGAPVIFINDARIDGLQRDGFYTEIADRIVQSVAPPQPAGN